MSTTSIIGELEEHFKAGAKPTEAHFKKLINTYVVNDDDKVGIATTEPKNTLDVKGQVVIGDGFGGEETAPANGLIVEGRVGIGHKFADEALHVNGNLKLEDGGLIIGGKQVISKTGLWEGKLPDSEDQEGSVHWVDGNEQVTTAVKVGIGEASPTADLHVKGDVRIDNGSLAVSGLVTKKDIAFTAHGYNAADSEKNGALTFQTLLPQATQDSGPFHSKSLFQPDAAKAGTYFFMVSLTMEEVKNDIQDENNPVESNPVPGSTGESVPENTGKPETDGHIFFSIDGGVEPLLDIRNPCSCLHSSASLVHYFNDQTILSLHSSVKDIKIAQITLTGYRL